MIKVICTNCGDTIIDDEVYCNECRKNAKDSDVAHGLVKFFADNYGMMEGWCPADNDRGCPNNMCEISTVYCENHRRLPYICWIQSYTGLDRDECMRLIGDQNRT